ncbi:MAG: hypothetical protein M3137_17790 [Actinomycetota bacterium]|nr:hypothetical protein [Actinomycetota bacterium]
MNKLTSTTTKWAAAGAAFGVSVAVTAGLAFASGPSTPTTLNPRPAAVTTTTTPAGNPTNPAGNPTNPAMGPMVSAMLNGLSPHARAQFEALYPQMKAFMTSGHMMDGSSTMANMMGNSGSPGSASKSGAGSMMGSNR